MTAPARTIRNTTSLGAGAGLPMGALLAHHAARDPKRAALIVGEEIVTRETLEAASNRRARELEKLGVARGDFVTLALRNGRELYETTFAIWKLGAIPNVVSPALPAAELDAIIRLADPKVVVAEPTLVPSGRPALAAGRPLDPALSAEALPVQTSPHWKAMTSGGSTGRPKVILDSMAGVWDPSVGLMGQQPEDMLLNPGPLYHNSPFIYMHAGLFAGSTVVEMGRFDPEHALRLIDRHSVGWVNFVPTMMNRIWKLGDETRAAYSLASLHTVFHMAAPCPAWLKLAFIDWLGPNRLFELYGSSERIGSTIISGEEYLAHRGSVGRPQAGTSIRVLREDGSEAAAGETGEIYFLPNSGPGSTYRYIGAEPRRQGDWESVGDLGWFDADGYLYVADRRTDMILSGGANIYPAEVEAALDAHPEVMSSAVIGLPDADWGQSVHALVQLRSGAQVSEDQLRNHLASRLARYKLPKSFEFSSAPLRDDAGKVRRSALRAARLATGPQAGGA